MAIQLAAAIAPVVKKVGIEIATEVAYKMLHEETRRRKAKIKQLRENGGLGTSMDAPKPDMKQRVKNFGNRVAYEVLDSKALNTGIGAVVGSISTAVSSNIRTPEEEVLFKKKGHRKPNGRRLSKETARLRRTPKERVYTDN